MLNIGWDTRQPPAELNRTKWIQLNYQELIDSVITAVSLFDELFVIIADMNKKTKVE